MSFKLIVQRAVRWLLVASLLGSGLAMAQAEPSLNQIYATAQAGKLDEAQAMIQQVLVAHPKSAKAYFVRSELYARQGKLGLARGSLATAEKLSPNLPFVKADAVQALRAQLASKYSPRAASGSAVNYAGPVAAASSSSSSWDLPLLLAAGVILAGYFMFRRRVPVPVAQQPGNAVQGGLGGLQGFGSAGAGNMQPGYPQQPGYPPQAGGGLGGRIMGGVATGLAVGAGVMAAEAIGRNLMGNHNFPAGLSNNLGNDFQTINTNGDMGGADFGIADNGSWDDAGSADVGGGSDWDN